MKTLIEKATEYTDSITPYSAYISNLILRAYLAGATEALAGLWRKYPDEDFPDTGNEYILRTDTGILSVVPKYVKKEEVKQYTNIVAWMPIPPSKDESE